MKSKDINGYDLFNAKITAMDFVTSGQLCTPVVSFVLGSESSALGSERKCSTPVAFDQETFAHLMHACDASKLMECVGAVVRVGFLGTDLTVVAHILTDEINVYLPGASGISAAKLAASSDSDQTTRP